jgi:hypothetical protein
MAQRISVGTNLPKEMARYGKWPAILRGKVEDSCDIRTEVRLAMDADFFPTQWFDPNTWVRCVVDALAIDGDYRYAVALDWKTGRNIEPEFGQLGITSSIVMARYPS